MQKYSKSHLKKIFYKIFSKAYFIYLPDLHFAIKIPCSQVSLLYTGSTKCSTFQSFWFFYLNEFKRVISLRLKIISSTKNKSNATHWCSVACSEENHSWLRCQICMTWCWQINQPSTYWSKQREGYMYHTMKVQFLSTLQCILRYIEKL